MKLKTHLPDTVRSPMVVSGFLLLLAIILSISTFQFTSDYDPAIFDAGNRFNPPSVSNPLGTDRYGRDVLSQVLLGGRITLATCSMAMITVMFIGITFGIVAGYSGGIVDRILLSLIDVLLSFPSTVLAIVIAGFFGPSLKNLLIAVTCFWWVRFAQITRGMVLKIIHEPDIEAAVAIGASRFTIIFRELLPRVTGPIIILATMELGKLILTISGLSFLGLGAQPPTPEWGALLSDGRVYLTRAPHLIFAPGIAIFLTVLSLNLLGEGLLSLNKGLKKEEVELL